MLLKSSLQRKLYIALSVVATILFVAIFLCSIFFSHGQDTKLFSFDKKLHRENFYVDGEKIEMPYRIRCMPGKTFTVSTYLPDGIQDGDIISFKSTNALNVILIDGKEVCRFGDQLPLPFGHMTGNVRLEIPVNEKDIGKKMDIEVTPYIAFTYEVNGIEYANREEFITYFYVTDFTFVCGMTFFGLVGVICLATAALQYGVKIRKKNSLLWNYALFSLSMAVILYCVSDLFQFQLKYFAMGGYVMNISLLFIPLSVAGMCRELIPNTDKYFVKTQIMGAVIAIIMTLLYLLGIAEASDIQIMVFLYSPIVLIQAIILAFKNRKKDKYAKLIFWNLCVFCAFMIDVEYILIIIGNLLRALGMLLLGILIFSIGMIYLVVSKSIDSSKELLKASVYDKMAHIDSMTGLRNRLCLDKCFADLEKTGIGNNILFAMCDLNYLKKTNDKFGHEAGDQLLIGAAQCLEKTVEENGTCFRMGGDEFGVLCVNPPFHGEEFVKKLEDVISKWNDNSKVHMSISVGVAEKEMKNENGFFRELYRIADDNMYLEKKRIHDLNGD